MAETTSERAGDLELDQDLGFQRREWAAQRIGWVVMALVALAALLGLTGEGPFASAAVGNPGDTLHVTYDRFERLLSPATLAAEIAGAAVAGETVEFWVDRAYLEGVEVQEVVPEPEEVRAGSDRLTYVFAVEEPGQPLTVTFDLRHTGFGWKSARAGLAGGPEVAFGQLVYP